jgi:hypothetical protein
LTTTWNFLIIIIILVYHHHLLKIFLRFFFFKFRRLHWCWWCISLRQGLLLWLLLLKLLNQNTGWNATSSGLAGSLAGASHQQNFRI